MYTSSQDNHIWDLYIVLYVSYLLCDLCNTVCDVSNVIVHDVTVHDYTATPTQLSALRPWIEFESWRGPGEAAGNVKVGATFGLRRGDDILRGDGIVNFLVGDFGDFGDPGEPFLLDPVISGVSSS